MFNHNSNKVHNFLKNNSKQEVKEPAKDKGELLGECNRTACHNRAAIWYNHGTYKHYCTACAREINEWSPNLLTLVKVTDEERIESICKDAN